MGCESIDALRPVYDQWAIGNFRAGGELFDDKVLCEWDYEIEELIERPDTVAVRIHQWGRGKGSGIPVDSRFWQVWEMRDGKAVRVAHREELGGEWS